MTIERKKYCMNDCIFVKHLVVATIKTFPACSSSNSSSLLLKMINLLISFIIFCILDTSWFSNITTLFVKQNNFNRLLVTVTRKFDYSFKENKIKKH